MCHRAGQLNVRHALTSDLGQRDFNATLLADHTAMLEPLVLATQALIVFNRSKNFGAEQAVTLGLECTVVNRLWLFNFTKGPRANHFGRRQSDTNGIELFCFSLGLQ